MPATRSSSMNHRAQPFTTPSPPHKQPSYNTDTISLTSSDQELSTVKKRQDKARLRPKKTTRIQPVEDVIEISSDDESPRTSHPSVVADYRRQLNKLREESVKYKKDFERASRELKDAREEIQQLQTLHKPDNGKILLDTAQVTDHLDCEICTSRMWTPYILPDCGHAFCQSCLQDWFSTTKVQFLATHPENDPNRIQNTAILVNLLQTITQNPQYMNLPHLTTMINQYMPPNPTFTCPTCREPVRSRPTEAFGLKALVRTIATATGEKSPKKKTQAGRKGKAPGNAPGPWDGFFPPKKP